tara:strand:+ start:361 stop:468 length:108 start_codon:yes stop_codon:yes gene_type:complete
MLNPSGKDSLPKLQIEELQVLLPLAEVKAEELQTA